MDEHLERALDIRTMLRLQSLMLAVVRQVFEPSHYRLLSLQRKGNLFDLEEHIDAAEFLLYDEGGSDKFKHNLARSSTFKDALESVRIGDDIDLQFSLEE